jgi:hypothetical protein
MLELVWCDSDSAVVADTTAHFGNQPLPLCLLALRSCHPVFAEQPDEADEVGRIHVINEEKCQKNGKLYGTQKLNEKKMFRMNGKCQKIMKKISVNAK